MSAGKKKYDIILLQTLFAPQRHGRTDETLSRRFSPLSCYCEVKKEEKKKRWEKALSSPFLLLDEEDLKKTLTGKISVRHKVLASINKSS